MLPLVNPLLGEKVVLCVALFASVAYVSLRLKKHHLSIFFKEDYWVQMPAASFITRGGCGYVVRWFSRLAGL